VTKNRKYRLLAIGLSIFILIGIISLFPACLMGGQKVTREAQPVLFLTFDGSAKILKDNSAVVNRIQGLVKQCQGKIGKGAEFGGKSSGICIANTGVITALGKDSVELSFWIRIKKKPSNFVCPIMKKINRKGDSKSGLVIFQVGSDIIFSLWDREGGMFGVRPHLSNGGTKMFTSPYKISDENQGVTDIRWKNTYYAVQVKPDTWTYISYRINLAGETIRVFWSDDRNCRLSVYRSPGIVSWANSADFLIGGEKDWHWEGSLDEIKLVVNPGPPEDNVALIPDQNNTFEQTEVKDPCVIADEGESGYSYRMWYTGLFRGYYYSILYAMSKDSYVWIRRSPTVAVLSRGLNGSFDSEYVRSPWVVRHGKKLRMWYTGWDQSYENEKNSVRIHERIGLAESLDGREWKKVKGSGAKGCCLDIGSPEAGDSLSVSEPSVLYWKGQWWMWYKGTDNQRRSSIFAATSKDGVSWSRKGKVLNIQGNEQNLGCPVVYGTDGKLSMYIQVKSAGGSSVTLTAASKNGLIWKRSGILNLSPLGKEWIGNETTIGSVIHENHMKKIWFSGVLKHVHTAYPDDYWKSNCCVIGYQEMPDE